LQNAVVFAEADEVVEELGDVPTQFNVRLLGGAQSVEGFHQAC
jgi:hypothetical protein